jgi:hypothetical protein
MMVRIEEYIDGTGRWHVDLFDHIDRSQPEKKEQRIFLTEAEARAHLETLYTSFGDFGRWMITIYTRNWREPFQKKVRYPAGHVPDQQK